MTSPTGEALVPPRERLMGILRSAGQKLLLVAMGLSVMLVLVLMHLRTDLHAAMAPLGPQLSSTGMLQALLDREQPISGEDRVLVINGQRLHLSTEVVDLAVEEALEASLADCPTRDELGGPVSAAGRGYALCVHSTTLASGVEPSLTERLETFRDTLDLADLGRLEYVYAEEREGGRTAMLRLASGEELDIDHLLPQQGDAMGMDPVGIPRPPDGRRILHSFEEGLPYAVTIYGRSERTVAQLQQWYRTHVDRTLWHEVDTAAQAEAQAVDISDIDMMVFVPNDDPTRFALVDFEERPASDSQAEGTMIMIAEAR